MVILVYGNYLQKVSVWIKIHRIIYDAVNGRIFPVAWPFVCGVASFSGDRICQLGNSISTDDDAKEPDGNHRPMPRDSTGGFTLIAAVLFVIAVEFMWHIHRTVQRQFLSQPTAECVWVQHADWHKLNCSLLLNVSSNCLIHLPLTTAIGTTFDKVICPNLFFAWSERRDGRHIEPWRCVLHKLREAIGLFSLD